MPPIAFVTPVVLVILSREIFARDQAEVVPILRLLIDVVASVDVPVTAKNPVVVELVVVKFVRIEVTALKIFAKKFDEVAFVVDEFVEKKLVVVAEVKSDVEAARVPA
jgi:hypothetical protein